MISKSTALAIVTLAVLVVPVGVLEVLQTAQAQIGQDIANEVLDGVFGISDGGGDDDGTEEESVTETEHGTEAGDDNHEIDQEQEQTSDQARTARQPVTQESSQHETNEVVN